MIKSTPSPPAPSPPQVKLALIGALVLSAIITSVLARWRSSATPAPRLSIAASLAPDAHASAEMVRFFAARVKRDPEDHVAQNGLASSYLQRLRETSDPDYLALAFRATHASLRSVPSVRNVSGLTALTQEEFAAHRFAAARDHALQLIPLEPDRSTPYQMLGDALLELGDYDRAAAEYQKMARLKDGIETCTRLARLAILHGNVVMGKEQLTKALGMALNLNPPSRETTAWCRWQLGEVAFGEGDYPSAERLYRDTLAGFPGYVPALASLARVRAARGDLTDAAAQYEQAVRLLPDNVVFAAALGDLYKLTGREKEAQAQYARVDQIGWPGRKSGDTSFDRGLALFYADHDLHAPEAYANAARSYKERRDIYGADILAWAAFKAGKTAEARVAMKAALRLGTRDARLFYHAGRIACATGDRNAGQDYLQRALALSPQFDPLQAIIAEKALNREMTNGLAAR